MSELAKSGGGRNLRDGSEERVGQGLLPNPPTGYRAPGPTSFPSSLFFPFFLQI